MSCSSIWKVKHSRKRGTDIERQLERYLKKRNVEYTPQAPVEGVALVDFLLPNKIIIQCDGDYWHSRPDVKERDIKQDALLINKGYTIYRFLGCLIKATDGACADIALNSQPRLNLPL